MLYKKDFRIIAKILVDAAEAHEIKYAGSVAHHFADYLATKNPRFDRQKFIEAIIGK